MLNLPLIVGQICTAIGGNTQAPVLPPVKATVISLSNCSDRLNTYQAWVEYHYKDGVLTLHHVNLYGDCCRSSLLLKTRYQNGELIILETLQSKPGPMSVPGCNCYYNAIIQVEGIPDTACQITIGPEYLHDPRERITFLLDLPNHKTGAVRIDWLPTVTTAFDKEYKYPFRIEYNPYAPNP